MEHLLAKLLVAVLIIGIVISLFFGTIRDAIDAKGNEVADQITQSNVD